MNMKRNMSKNKEQVHQIKSYLELYFKHGSLPSKHVNLNSKTELRSEKVENRRYAESDYIELEKHIPGTGVTIKEKILKISNISLDVTHKHLNQFEEIAMTNKWTDEQMGLIYHSLILDQRKEELPKDSFLKLRLAILNILYPVENKRKIMRNLDNTTQIQYSKCELIANGSKIKSQQQTITGNPKSETNKKWCSLHKLNYSHDTRNCNTLKNKTKKGALNDAINKNLIIQETSQEIKDVNGIASRNMIIKDYIKEKEQNIVNKNVKEKFNETFIYKESEDKYVEVDETEEIKINTKDTQQKPLIKNQTSQELLPETKLLIMKEEQIPTKHLEVSNKINIYETEIKNEHTNIRSITVKNDGHNIKLKFHKTKTYRHCKTTNNKHLVKINHLKYNNNNNKERDLMKKPDKDKTTRKLYKKYLERK
ncbi:hypothetical protein NAPIS_ORF02406 [Vairimorpha apis BRL 01]|uniref:Uncharacterized protein n=1 Tax=Vairimorpha apis BRL 01 TaxID=1037528 RepID=T0MG68_9MICR|nr:hypothetical protein NAPIS_ORF02406 [Vairimorpha apis BRL 01]